MPEKYTRLLRYITGSRILEIGAAEGVLSLMLAENRDVIALELRPERAEEGRSLQRQWKALGRSVDGCRFEVGDIRERLDLLKGVDTIVAVRSIYYLRDDAPAVIEAGARAGVTRVVLCGNRNRAAQHAANPNEDLGRFNRLASVDGMVELLHGAGYRIAQVVKEGDPIVVGSLGDG